jgi:hypothetical protein
VGGAAATRFYRARAATLAATPCPRPSTRSFNKPGES